MDSLDHGVWRCRYLCRTKVRVFRPLVLPVLLYGCVTWTLTRDLRRRSIPLVPALFGESLAIAGQTLSNERLLRETQMRFATCIVCERQLWLYGHVAHFPDALPAHQILSARQSREWRRPICQPRALWLQQVDQHLNEMGMAKAYAWGMARRWPLKCQQKVDAAMCCSDAYFHI